MRIINKKYLLIIILVGIILTGAIIFKPKQEVKLDNVILKQEVNNKTFAMYKEDGENSYVEVENNKFPDMYVLNITKSKCIDNNGNELDGILSYENDKVIITSGNTTYCYLYFDKSLGLEIREKSPNKLSEEIKGAMYRFQGQQNDGVNNYICFGTSDLEECTANQDKHMYRIIGIEAETGRVKVIKKEALKDPIAWADNYDNDIEFPESNIYKAINGDNFLTNKEFIPNGWDGKISNNTWMYGDMMGGSLMGGLQNGLEIYKVETGQKETRYQYKNILDDGNVTSEVIDTTWIKKKDFKISLMYVHDYYLAVNDEVICFKDKDEAVCKDSWINLSSNTQDNYDEWLMTRYGFYEHYYGYVISDDGDAVMSTVTLSRNIRPVFYIFASQNLKSGTGTLEDPFIIE